MIRYSVKFTHNEELLPEVTSVQINALIISYIKVETSRYNYQRGD